MLSFALPLALWLGLSLLPAAAFYFLRLRFRKQPAGSIFLWRQVLRESDQGRRWRRKSILLFLLQALALAALTLAAAGPLLTSEHPAENGVVFLMDASASMGAREPPVGDSRWSRAVAALGARLAALPPDTPVAVFRCADNAAWPDPGRADMPGWRARDAGAITRLLAGQEVAAAGFREEAVAASVQAWVAKRGGSWRAELIGDGGTDLDGRRLAAAFAAGLSQVVIGGQPDDLGLLGLRPAAGDADGLEATALNSSGTGRSVTLVLERDGTVIRRLDRTLAAGASQIQVALAGGDDGSADSGGFLADFSGNATIGNDGSATVKAPLPAGLYRLSIKDAADALAANDSVLLAVNAPRPLRVLHIGPANPFLAAAFADADYRQSAAWMPEPDGGWDLVVADGVPPPPQARGNLLCLASLPSDAPVAWGQALSGTLAAVESDHPLARWIDWQECPVASGRAFADVGAVRVLARVDGLPVLVAWESGGRRVAACGTDLFRSSMGLSGAFPVFIRNLALWVVPQADNPLADTLEAGVPAKRAESAAWELAAGPVVSGRGADGLVTLVGQAPGSAPWRDGPRRGVIAVNPARSESGLAARTLPGIALAGEAPAATTATAAAAGSADLAKFQRDVLPLAFLPLLIGMACLAAEWLLWYGLPAWLLPAWAARRHPATTPRRQPSAATRRTVRPLFALRLASLALLVLALGGLAVPVPSQRQNLAVLIDCSASLGADALAEARRIAWAQLDLLRPGDRALLVSFADGARLESAADTPAATRAALDRLVLDAGGRAGQTDVKAALTLARHALEGLGGNSAVLLISDGRPTRGGGLQALAAAGQAWPVHCVPVGHPAAGIRAGELAAPGLVHAGDSILVAWSVTSDAAAEIQVDAILDGSPLPRRTVKLTPGENSVGLPLAISAAGRHRLEARLSQADGTPLPGGERAVMVEAAGPPRVLLVDGEDSPSPLAAALAVQGFSVERTGAAGLPAERAALDGASAVILDNVSALDLSEAQQTALVARVASGGGLLVIGGDQSLGRGEYYATALEDLLPVRTDERQRLLFTRSRLLFVVDHSGSMGEAVGRETKLQVALRGVAEAINRLNPLDEAGVLTFDSAPSWALPFTPASRKDAIKAALASIPEGGGTDMAAALEEVVSAMGRPGPTRRHVILLTDGETANVEAHFQELCASLRGVGVSVSAIGIGEEINTALLKNLADWGEGSFYRANVDEVPRILTKETVRVTRELIQEGRFLPRVLRGGGPVAGLETAFPAVGGYLLCAARPQAQVWLALDRPAAAGTAAPGGTDPLLASWRYGNGGVAIFTGDSGRRWLSAWSAPTYQRFWAQLVRSVGQGGADRGLQASLSVEAGQAVLSVDALDSARRLQGGLSLSAGDGVNSYTLSETAPGHYQTVVPAGPAGLAVFEIRESGGGRRTAVSAWNPGGEDAGLGPDLPGLGGLAAASGGLLLPRDTTIPLPRPAGTEPWPLAWLFAALAALAFLAELGWRSTMTGQLPMARARLSLWWQAQRAALERYRRHEPEASEPAHTAESQRKVMDAYRYLALLSQQREAAEGTPSSSGDPRVHDDDRQLDADRPRRGLLKRLAGKR
jgi:Mg-chelatase subunit ChlD